MQKMGKTIVREKIPHFAGCFLLSPSCIQRILVSTDTVVGTGDIKTRAVLSLKLTDPGEESSKHKFRVV